MTQTYRQKIGRWGEQSAADYLQSRGYTLLATNVRTPYGEIDLIALQHTPDSVDGVVVFVEVKTRTSTAFGLPEESITAKKKEHLLSASQSYLQEHEDLPGNWRIDGISIRKLVGEAQPEIYHFENILA